MRAAILGEPAPPARARAVPRPSAHGNERLPLLLALAFAAEVVVLGWNPHDRGDWLLENLISLPFATALVLGRRRLPFSSLSWCLLFGFLALHEIGSHYTYSRVPWMEWSRRALGWAPAWDRNHYDRLLHLAFGLCSTLPLAEWLNRSLGAASWWLRNLLPVCCIAALSAVYELLEWGAAALVDPALGIAFVGAQGDIWDAQKDMALALGGSAVVAASRAWRAARAGRALRIRMRPGRSGTRSRRA